MMALAMVPLVLPTLLLLLLLVRVPLQSASPTCHGKAT